MTQGWHIAMLQPQATQFSLDEHDLWESRVARILRARGYQVYYPGIPRTTHQRHRLPRIALAPMFPGYLFVRSHPRGWDMLRTTPGIRLGQSLLINPATGRLAVLSDDEFWRIAEIELIKMDQALNPPKKELPYKIGDRVRVTGGPFEGRWANIETLDDNERIGLLLDIFGRQTRVLASPDWLAPAPAPAIA